MPRGDDESGVYLPPGEYPKAPRRPPSADHEHSLSGPPWRQRIWKRVRGIPPRTAAAFIATAILGGMFGWCLHPDARSGDSKEAAKAMERAKVAEAELAHAKQALAAAPAAGSGSGSAAGKPDEAQLGKLAAAVGSEGEVTSSGGEIRLQLVDKILFAPGEAVLTARGKTVLARVGKALNDISDKQIWVQGHTDDEPIVVPKPPAPAKGKAAAAKGKGKVAKGKGAKKPAPAPPPPPPRFASNWELSAARALTVVHYLQDKVKVDPTRLAAVAFGQYRPAGKSKAKNRRIEIVLYPRHQVAP